MPNKTLSEHAFHSFSFLLDLADQDGFFSIGDDRALMQRELPTPHADQLKLIVSGEALCLQQLVELQSLVQPVLEVQGFRVLSVAGSTHRVKVSFVVSAKQEETLVEVMESVANALHLEINLLSDTPTLSEPGLLVMDMDSTVIDIECIDEIAKLAGVGDKVSEVTELAMQGKLDFAESLNQRVGCLQGAHSDILHAVRQRLPLMPGITQLVSELKGHGWKLAIASGGFTYFADHLANKLQLDAAVSNELVIENNLLTGTVNGQIVDAQVKADTLRSLADKWQIPASQTIALGDGANDLVMMSAAGLGVAYHAKPIVRQKAAASIRFGGLDTLLTLLDE